MLAKHGYFNEYAPAGGDVGGSALLVPPPCGPAGPWRGPPRHLREPACDERACKSDCGFLQDRSRHQHALLRARLGRGSACLSGPGPPSLLSFPEFVLRSLCRRGSHEEVHVARLASYSPASKPGVSICDVWLKMPAIYVCTPTGAHVRVHRCGSISHVSGLPSFHLTVHRSAVWPVQRSKVTVTLALRAGLDGDAKG